MAADRQDLIRTAERLVSRGKLNAAITSYLKILDRYPDDTSTLNRVGDLYARLRRLDEAVELFRRAGQHFAEEGFFVKAIAIYKKILRLDPTQLEVSESVADLQARQGLVNDARQQYLAVADGYSKKGDLPSTTAVHRKLVELEPADPAHRLHLAELLKRQQNIPEAMAQFRTIAEQLLSHGKVEEALKVCRETLELDPKNLNFVSNVVGELERTGNQDAADEFFDLAVEKNPDAAKVRAAPEEAPAEVEEAVPPDLEAKDVLAALGLEEEEGPATVSAEAPAESLEAEEPEVYELELDEEQEVEIELELEDFEVEPAPEEVVAVAEPPEEVERLKELLIEADVLARYGLEEKAIEKLEEIVDLVPTHLDAHCRLATLYLEGNEPGRTAEVASTAGKLAKAQSEPKTWEELEEQLTAAGFRIEADEVIAPEVVEAPAGEEPTVPAQEAEAEEISWLDEAAATGAPEEAVFDAEAEFFDLATELEKELVEEEGLLEEDLVIAPEEQSLEEIVEGFRQGMAETLSPEDYDTHYNLGIAYREMGLLDEAISEFQLAAKDSRYLVDCCSLLASCFIEKGFPELAVKWYNEGLTSPIITEEETLGLVYELGDLYLAMGETEEARLRFVEIYGVNSDYRDVGSKLAQLDQG